MYHTHTLDLHFWAKEKIGVEDPDLVNLDRDTDPSFQVNPDTNPGFWWLKIEEKNTAGMAIYLSLHIDFIRALSVVGET